MPSSLRAAPSNAIDLGQPNPQTAISVTVYLKSTRLSPTRRAHSGRGAALTRSELRDQNKLDFAEAAVAFRAFSALNALEMYDRTDQRVIVLSGTMAAVTRAFGAQVRIYDDGVRRFRARAGVLTAPSNVMPWIRAVLGFDERSLGSSRLQSYALDGGVQGLWPTEVAKLYGATDVLTGAGQCIGIVALAGGYLPSDLSAAAAAVGHEAPLVIDRSIDGASNIFEGGTTNDEEIALDLQVVAAIAPSVRIVVYFAKNSLQGLAAALHDAVYDDVNRPQVLSISWGSAEKFWTGAARDAVQTVLADAVNLKVSVVAAAGDFLATAGLSDSAGHVLFPASSPYVIGCGGTQLPVNDADATIPETVWHDGWTGTGGGISDVFPVPSYQTQISLPVSINDGLRRRGVPDVAAAAGRNPGYRIILNGRPIIKEGTSAGTPLWAALITLANAERGQPLGMINPFLYANLHVFQTILNGDNRIDGIGYEAAPGWSACTGLGPPHAQELISALIQVP